MDFTRHYDIIVAGAGVAGVAAALEAARSGFKTALVEKTILLGGLATTGLVNVYLPLCDGKGRQVIFGIAEELLHLSIKYGPGSIPAGWKGSEPGAPAGRYLVRFSPAAFILAIDEALQDAGVEIWLDTAACCPVIEGGQVTGIEVENKSGRGLLSARCLVDATGEADLIHRAGAPCAEAQNWMSVWTHQISAQRLEQALDGVSAEALLNATTLRLGANDRGAGHPPGYPLYSGTDGESVTRFVLDSRRLLREYYQQQVASSAATRHTLFPVTLPSMAQFRMTRRIEGVESILENQNNLHRATSVGLTGDWRKPGPVWEIPYGALVPKGVQGILAAGRCIDSRDDAWQVLRVIPPAALTGQIAGVAAGLAVRSGITPDQVPADQVQREMHRRGIPCHLEDLPDL
ncbi:MAG TPA: FAD-dependent oxidoreductase [Anaerolineaceae bacterium]